MHLPAHEDGTDRVPKRRHVKFRCRGITLKKAYNKALIVFPTHVVTDPGFGGCGRNQDRDVSLRCPYLIPPR